MDGQVLICKHVVMVPAAPTSPLGHSPPPRRPSVGICGCRLTSIMVGTSMTMERRSPKLETPHGAPVLSPFCSFPLCSQLASPDDSVRYSTASQRPLRLTPASHSCPEIPRTSKHVAKRSDRPPVPTPSSKWQALRLLPQYSTVPISNASYVSAPSPSQAQTPIRPPSGSGAADIQICGS